MERLHQLETIVRRAGEIILSATSIEAVTEKKTSAADLVTAYDRRVEDFLKAELLALMPEAIFYGEEETERQDPRRGWAYIVDPIDGTCNFVHHLSQSAISVALAYDGQTAYAVVLDPYKNELFSAKRGAGAYLNGQPIHVSRSPLREGIFGIGTSPYHPEYREKTFRITWQLLERSCDFRRMGAAALDLCDLAAGRLDAFFECVLSPWDYAAGALMIEEAGGHIMTLDGKPLSLPGVTSVWASNDVNREILFELNL